MSKTENEKKQPSHTIWQVLENGDKARWIRLGAAWRNRDDKGFTLEFDAMPISNRVVIRERTYKPEASE